MFQLQNLTAKNKLQTCGVEDSLKMFACTDDTGENSKIFTF